MPRLATDVHVKDPDTRLMVHLQAGSEPEPRYAALVTNPDCWEHGQAPQPADTSDSGDKPAAAKKTAAKKPARGRSAADEGSSGA